MRPCTRGKEEKEEGGKGGEKEKGKKGEEKKTWKVIFRLPPLFLMRGRWASKITDQYGEKKEEGGGKEEGRGGKGGEGGKGGKRKKSFKNFGGCAPMPPHNARGSHPLRPPSGLRPAGITSWMGFLRSLCDQLE